MTFAVLLIRTIHLAIVFAVIASVFIRSCYVKQLALAFLIFLLFQYILGYESCGLTKIEYVLLGEEKYKQGFMYRLINPIIKVPESYFDSALFYAHIFWIIILSYQIFNARCKFVLLD